MAHWGSGLSGAPERRQCSPSKQPAAKAAPLFCPLRREISPLRSATVEMTIGVPANIIISSGDACRYGADGKRFDDTLSPEISQRNAARTIRGGISPLRNAFVEMTEGAPPFFTICTRRAPPQPSACKAVKLKNPPANGRSILRTFFHNPSTQPAA